MRVRTCHVERWSQFHPRDEQRARNLLLSAKRPRTANRLRRKPMAFPNLQPTGVFCPDGLTLEAIGVPVPVRALEGCAVLALAAEDEDRALELFAHIIHDQITQLGEAHEAGARGGASRLVVRIRVIEYLPVGGQRQVEGAMEMLAMLERELGMQRFDMPRTRPARRFRCSYRCMTAERAAEIYRSLPAMSHPPRPAPAVGLPAASEALPPSVAPETPPALSAAGGTAAATAETETRIKVGLGAGVLGYSFSGELVRTRKLHVPGRREPPENAPGDGDE